MCDRTRGLYNKFRVERVDGTHEPGKKHDGCEYFVLDITHDPHAPAALEAYADSAEADGYVELAEDLREKALLARMHPRPRWGEEGGDDGRPQPQPEEASS